MAELFHCLACRAQTLDLFIQGMADNNPLRFRTALCRHWVTGGCPYQDRCLFAHGVDQLRTLSENRDAGMFTHDDVKHHLVHAEPAANSSLFWRNLTAIHWCLAVNKADIGQPTVTLLVRSAADAALFAITGHLIGLLEDNHRVELMDKHGELKKVNIERIVEISMKPPTL